MLDKKVSKLNVGFKNKTGSADPLNHIGDALVVPVVEVLSSQESPLAIASKIAKRPSKRAQKVIEKPGDNIQVIEELRHSEPPSPIEPPLTKIANTAEDNLVDIQLDGSEPSFSVNEDIYDGAFLKRYASLKDIQKVNHKRLAIIGILMTSVATVLYATTGSQIPTPITPSIVHLPPQSTSSPATPALPIVVDASAPTQGLANGDIDKKIADIKALSEQIAGLAKSTNQDLVATKKNLNEEFKSQKNELLAQIYELQSSLDSARRAAETDKSIIDLKNREIGELKRQSVIAANKLAETESHLAQLGSELQTASASVATIVNEKDRLASLNLRLNNEADDLREQNGKLNITLSQERRDRRQQSRLDILPVNTNSVGSVQTNTERASFQELKPDVRTELSHPLMPDISAEPPKVVVTPKKDTPKLEKPKHDHDMVKKNDKPKKENHQSASSESRLDNFNVIGISSDSVAVSINGNPKTVSIGSSIDGVKFLSIDEDKGIIKTSEGILKIN